MLWIKVNKGTSLCRGSWIGYRQWSSSRLTSPYSLRYALSVGQQVLLKLSLLCMYVYMMKCVVCMYVWVPISKLNMFRYHFHLRRRHLPQDLSICIYVCMYVCVLILINCFYNSAVFLYMQYVCSMYVCMHEWMMLTLTIEFELSFRAQPSSFVRVSAANIRPR